MSWAVVSPDRIAKKLCWCWMNQCWVDASHARRSRATLSKDFDEFVFVVFILDPELMSFSKAVSKTPKLPRAPNHFFGAKTLLGWVADIFAAFWITRVKEATTSSIWWFCTDARAQFAHRALALYCNLRIWTSRDCRMILSRVVEHIAHT